MAGAFVGDIGSAAAWQALSEDPRAALVDVRSPAEWEFVGLPDPTPLGRSLVKVAWLSWPGLEINAGFAAEVAAAGVTPDRTVYLLCRSGARSRSAAQALAARGYRTVNIADGFEGPLGPDGRRGHAGWRAAGLPWRQS